jgi:hypothetical protein
MCTIKSKLSLVIVFTVLCFEVSAQEIALTPTNLEAVNVKTSSVSFKGKNAVRVIGIEDGEQIAIVKNIDFKNGTIEIDVAGQPVPNADPSFRGFIGIAFRVQQSDSLRYECFYLRPTNGRAEDQLRRNHSTQYISHPGFPWFKLRKEMPGVYESYVDLVSGEWTKIKIVANDKDARLYVNGADQPCLIVKDLKGKMTNGSIALWIGPGTDGYFTNLKIKQ